MKYETEYANRVIDGEWSADYIESYDLNEPDQAVLAFEQTINLFKIANRPVDFDVVQDILNFNRNNELINQLVREAIE